jgi:chaperonin cofactor prefoldin
MTLPDSIIKAIAGATVLAAGGAIISSKVHDAEQDQRIERVERLDTDVSGLRNDIQKVDIKLEHLNTELDDERSPRPK